MWKKGKLNSEKIWKIQKKLEIRWKIWKKSKLNSKKILKMRKKSRLNCEMIWKIWKKIKLNSEKIGKIWKKDKLNCQMIWKIWKKSKLISEKIWKIQKKSKLNSENMEDFCVCHNYTQRDLLLLLSLPPSPYLHPTLLLPLPASSFSSSFPPSSSSSLYTCIYIVFQN